MNREEAFEVLNFEVEEAKVVHLEDYYDASKKARAGAFIGAVERLKQPLTLAEFLGWEEGAEYMCLAGKYKVEDGELLHYSNVMQDYWPAKVYLNHSRTLAMRRAKRVKPKKKYRIPLPNLITTDGMQQYLTEKDGHWFASRLTDNLKQEWTEDELDSIPGAYRICAKEVVE